LESKSQILVDPFSTRLTNPPISRFVFFYYKVENRGQGNECGGGEKFAELEYIERCGDDSAFVTDKEDSIVKEFIGEKGNNLKNGINQ
jgi:hypothetical protein